ncbi:Taurine import ATP-binding protein TauB [bioreactor metagenome]|jgi:ABC-type nitrate/sulfonate/bicarbonate transport system ATPase subunit|uniref:ABC-type nitrate/sulfonate/bicarbonate transport system ATPase subunit n=2 Tax=root TaxID=1 RepID=A0A562JBD2_9FIRM|nr:ABC transporter ATP-binding protein [Sedimentibacter saalensis]MEA5094175.1 ABC transporter ATP-binding protein [Sedimentibacter saalensis]TWH80400.1 ABC-type nitrate/sulfonate/bicarbonate transport system ATPase subunit [Sedimentibacter saalensis]
MNKLTTKNITVFYDGSKVIDDISIELRQGEIVSILGVSGVGKTTLFNVISGLVMPDSGTVELDGKNITGTTGNVSYMLQKDLLLPYKTIIDNVSLPLIIRGEKKSKAREYTAKYFEEFGLSGTEYKYPRQLSGGMRQRAALLRTYLFSNQVALLDEPFSALDNITKGNMHQWYLQVMEQIKLSTFLITHDIDEAILLSDRIYIIAGKPGKITEEIIIDEAKPRHKDFIVSENFMNYKKHIIKSLE